MVIDLQDFMATMNNRKRNILGAYWERLSTLSAAPRLYGGDFNQILKVKEKRRGSPKEHKLDF